MADRTRTIDIALNFRSRGAEAAASDIRKVKDEARAARAEEIAARRAQIDERIRMLENARWARANPEDFWKANQGQVRQRLKSALGGMDISSVPEADLKQFAMSGIIAEEEKLQKELARLRKQDINARMAHARQIEAEMIKQEMAQRRMERHGTRAAMGLLALSNAIVQIENSANKATGIMNAMASSLAMFSQSAGIGRLGNIAFGAAIGVQVFAGLHQLWLSHTNKLAEAIRANASGGSNVGKSAREIAMEHYDKQANFWANNAAQLQTAAQILRFTMGLSGAMMAPKYEAMAAESRKKAEGFQRQLDTVRKDAIREEESKKIQDQARAYIDSTMTETERREAKLKDVDNLLSKFSEAIKQAQTAGKLGEVRRLQELQSQVQVSRERMAKEKTAAEKDQAWEIVGGASRLGRPMSAAEASGSFRPYSARGGASVTINVNADGPIGAAIGAYSAETTMSILKQLGMLN